jgi:hypothetical protein
MEWEEFCLECGDFFHEDDTGGYNPECRCGKEHCVSLCRSCCEAIESRMSDPEDIEDGGSASGDAP